MFTGIITDVGTVRSVAATEAGRRLTVATRFDLATVEIGASIACAGVCLTVVERGPDWFAVEASPETLAATTVGDWTAGRRINLERALRVGDELGGHIVLGHVDGVGRVAERRKEGDNCRLRVDLPAASDLGRYVAPKGAVAIDGVSLTVNEVRGPSAPEQSFALNVIPYTLSQTTLADLDQGDRVNLEVDMMARYAARLLDHLSG